MVTQKMETPTIAVVILNYNGQHWLEKFLADVVQKSPEATVYVADNASTDNSVEYLQQEHPNVKLIINKENTGYAGGYREALKNLCADYYVLLNSDIEVSENWINPVIQRMEDNPQIAACQPKILSYHQPRYFEHAGACGGFVDKDGYPYCRGRLFESVEEDKGQYDDAIPVFWATGACLFVRSTAYHEVDGLDADFFAHMEEIDLCWRLQNKGYEVWCEPKSTIYHVGGGTLQTSSPFKTYLNFRNNLYLLHKNYKGFLPLMILKRLILDGVAGLKFILDRNPKHCWAVVRAHFAYYKQLAKLQQKRKQLQQKVRLQKNSVLWAHFVKGIQSYSDL